MATLYLAGHSFENDRCMACGRMWIDIMHVDHSYVDAEGYAHSGKLTYSEASQIMAETQRRRERYESALRDLGR